MLNIGLALLLARAGDSLAHKYLHFHPAILTTSFLRTIVSHRTKIPVAERRDHSTQWNVVVLLQVPDHRVGSLLAQHSIASGVAR